MTCFSKRPFEREVDPRSVKDAKGIVSLMVTREVSEDGTGREQVVDFALPSGGA